MNPFSAAIHNNLGVALTKQGKFDDAIRHYREALRIDPEYRSARHSVGFALARKGKLKDAEAHFKEALLIRPGFMGARNNLKKTLALWMK